MGNKIDRSNLGYLGLEYQYRLAKEFIETPKFFQDLNAIIDQNVFTEPILKTLVGVIKDYYAQYSIVPSYEIIKTVLRSRARTTTDSQEYDALIDGIMRMPCDGSEFVRENAIKFFKQQNLIRAANQILKIAGDGDIDRYDDCKKLFDDAILAGEEDEFGVSPYELLDQALSPDSKYPIATGIKKLDEALNGGLEKGKLGLIIGSAGFGKSTFSTAIAAYASTNKTAQNGYQGDKVLQIYFEDDDLDITRKHFSRITQVEARHLTSDPAQTYEIKRTLENYPEKELMKNNLRLKRFKTNTKSATDIENYLRRLINSGFKPGLVIIDYFECLEPERGGYSTDSEWSREGRTMRKLENMAKDLNIALWVPTQGNKDSINSPDVVTMNQVGGSIKKVQVAQVIISIARSLDDIDNSRATIAVLKNRSGKSGEVFKDIRFDNGTSTISCDDVVTYDNALVYSENMRQATQDKFVNMARSLSEGIVPNESEFPV